MLTKMLEARSIARGAVVGLALGLIGLTGLSLWGNISMQRATSRLDALNDVSDQWNQILQRVDVEDHAMSDYLRSRGNDVLRQPLASAAGSALEHLAWLESHGAPDDVATVTRVRELYRTYTTIQQEILTSGDRQDLGRLELQGDEAKLALISLRKQLSAIIQVKRVHTAEYLDEADQKNRGLQVATFAAFGLNLGLVGLCAAVLISYRRRILRQVARNEHEALHDALTGLANRTLLAQRTEEAIERSRGSGEPVGLLLVDLNRFKEVNDTLGHVCGDRLLQRVAARLADAVRQDDTVARLGGDEFAVLLPRISSVTGAAEVAERMHAALGGPVDLDGLSVEVDGSIGIAVYPLDSTDADELLKYADIAMYAAKRNHLGVARYEPSLDEHSTARLAVVSELRRAIDHGELVLHYQPKAVTCSGAICGVEALARWQHPRRGLLGPGEFIPAAEENGLIGSLTRYVLSSALRQCHAWLMDGCTMPVSVNVGAQCLLDPTFPDQVAGLLDRHQVPPHMLTLEITESAIVADPARANLVLGELADSGVSLSIDDFGTGYSSIAYLQSMRVHEMKLDRLFVTELCSNPRNNAIVRTLLELAHAFELQVVAEGVEDGETWAALAELGCGIVQGFYLSKPLPADEFAAWLQQDGSRAHTRLAEL
ncbi:EAL domain-containing protein [Lentzea tibetensis]|uniref:EAL domain-containing protein n=1 Tax=Lentzea tibetensis TaxID=2591470 RepID=A0A563F1J0_9PSEU|nr:EAL domain-containing protein [Lentzea tibetensis]TWP53830.1 EAL domain-containing protein [Lentzea tibetensis]